MNSKKKIDLLDEKLVNFNKNNWAIKLHSTEGWGEQAPCPVRFTVNPYLGCEFKCPYCYVWSDKEKTGIKPGFRESLKKGIESAKKLNLEDYVVEVSASTDPFQYIEKDKGEALYSIQRVLDAGFKVLLVTKNPSFLLEKKYLTILQNKNIFIDVTITSLKEGTPKGSILNNKGPSAKEKIRIISKLISMGKDIRVKIEPVIPTTGDIIGQSKKDLEELVEELAKIGVKRIIAKTLRVNAWMPEYIKKNLVTFYKDNGQLIEGNYVLNKDLRKKLLTPIYFSCKRNNITFCGCVDADVFEGIKDIVPCTISGETLKKIRTLNETMHGCPSC